MFKNAKGKVCHAGLRDVMVGIEKLAFLHLLKVILSGGVEKMDDTAPFVDRDLSGTHRASILCFW